MDSNNIYKFPHTTMIIPLMYVSVELLAHYSVEDIDLCNADGDLIRDHYYIECTIQQSTPLQNRKIVAYRNVKQIDIESPTRNNIQGTVNELDDRYSLGLRAMLDKHAPIMHGVVTVRRHAP